jgi:hypothetical protein
LLCRRCSPEDLIPTGLLAGQEAPTASLPHVCDRMAYLGRASPMNSASSRVSVWRRRIAVVGG